MEKESLVIHPKKPKGEDDCKIEPLVIRPKRPKGEDGYKIFSIRIQEDVISQLDEISAKTGRSRNELIARFIEYGLQHYVIQTEETDE